MQAWGMTHAAGGQDPASGFQDTGADPGGGPVAVMREHHPSPITDSCRQQVH